MAREDVPCQPVSRCATGKTPQASGPANFAALNTQPCAVGADNSCMTRQREAYACECGFLTSQRFGRCPQCGAWGSLRPRKSEGAAGSVDPQPLCAVRAGETPRLGCGIAELDRVLGGGLVAGSLVLLGGEPGIGKSTLLLQCLAGLAEHVGPVLYVTGEESLEQVALRAQRLGVTEAELLALAETRLAQILGAAARMKPTVMAVDSVQTLQIEDASGAPGSPALVREATAALMAHAKSQGMPVILVGHVTKEGGLAGPKTLEHLVDAVLHFEGDPSGNHRVLRATKNRFGSTNEIGVFEMRGSGLREVANPSALFLAERAPGVPGSAVVVCVEGTRPILVEVQALTAAASGVPRRAVLGVDPYRVALLLAVCARRAGVDVLGHDVFVNVAGGVRLDEPAADLGVVAALASSASGRPVNPDAVCFGEVGLAGEVRTGGAIDLRLTEAAKLGFRRCVLPEASLRQARYHGELELVGVREVNAALAALLR
jgi:DNA repair protein RadA/Sms